MSIKTVLENTFVMKLAYTIAASAIIGGGTVVLTNQSRIAVLENGGQNLNAQLTRIEAKVDALFGELATDSRKPR